jgi:hypothetical protein
MINSELKASISATYINSRWWVHDWYYDSDSIHTTNNVKKLINPKRQILYYGP